MTAQAGDMRSEPEDSSHEGGSVRSAQAQIRRAWIVLGMAGLAFVALVIVAISGGIWVSRHATEARDARITFVSGSGVLIRSPGDADWRLIEADQLVSEGDSISTALGTVVTLTAFDGSAIEIAEDSVVTVHRMRASRFIKRTKLITLRPQRGAVYVNMAPAGDYSYSEVVVEAVGTHAVMASERARQQTGAFLAEIVSPSDGAPSTDASVRTAVLRGQATITRAGMQLTLTENQQTVIDPAGVAGPITAPVRELLVNGSFEHGMDGWVDFRQQSAQQAGVVPVDASVDLVSDQTQSGDVVALEISRPSDGRGGVVQAGVRQRIGKTLRVVTSLRVQFDVRITDQQPAGGGDDLNQFPLTVTLDYVDVEGKERTWSHGYYVVADPARPVDEFRGSRVERDVWRRISFDLSNLKPLPRQITAIVLYASGESYQTRVTNVSLTSGELLRETGNTSQNVPAASARAAGAGGGN